MVAVALVLASLVCSELLILLIWLRLKPRRASQLRWLAASGGALILAPVLLLVAYAYLAPLQSPYERLDQPGFVVLDAKGVVLQRDTREGLRVPVALQDMAPVMVQATIAAEDARFRGHPGVDPIAIARALVELPFHRSGASTITQQVARRLYLQDGGGPLLERKAREALVSLQLEARYSKDEILALYLNNVYYGRGAYGVEAAARVYFGVSAKNLDLAQAAFLAGLPQSPAAYGAAGDSVAGQKRRDYVLRRLVETGAIEPAEALTASDEPLDFLPRQAPVIAPHFLLYVLDELQELRPDLAGQRGLVIETTLDAALEQETERLVGFQLASLKDKAVGSAAVVVLEPASGRILTLTGSADFYDDAAGGQNDMALALRQPGSALKPFLYAAAFERGFTAASQLLDIPTTFATAAGPYSPLDYDRRFRGPVSLRTALASSLNVPAVRTLEQVGIDSFLDMAHRFGLSSLTDTEVYGLSLTLGGGEVRLLDLTNAYAALANGGRLTQPYAIERVRDSAGRVLYEHRQQASAQVVSPEIAYVLSDILSDPLARQVGFGDAVALSLPFRAAVKTGTTTEFRDNWTLGYTPERAVGVWAGNADGRPMQNVSGIDGAGPIWRSVMAAAHAGLSATWPRPPAGLVRATVCAPTGLLPGPDCPTTMEEWFLAGSQPLASETYYGRDESGRLVINPPPEARAWALEAGLPLAAVAASSHRRPFIVQPAAGSVLFLAPEIPDQAIVLKASPPPGANAIEFRVDGVLVATTPANDPSAVWPLSEGRHLLEVRALLQDGSAVEASASYEVRK